MTDPLPPWPDDPPTGGPHAGPGPALAGIAAIGGSVVVLLLVAGLVGLVLAVAWIGGSW